MAITHFPKIVKMKIGPLLGNNFCLDFVIRTVKTWIYSTLLLLLAVKASPVQAQTPAVPIVKWDWLQAKMAQQTDTVYVINFWATWCRPCVEEMPDLLKAEKDLAGQPVKFIFVSLDFKADAAKRVQPFVRKRRMTSVVLLDEPDYNKWLPRVDKKWEGNIPATLILRNAQKKRIFLPRELKPGEIETLVRAVLSNSAKS